MSELLKYPGLTAPGEDNEHLYMMRNHGGIHRLHELLGFIKYAAQSYYEGSPKVPNAAFDEAVKLLKLNDPTNPVLTTPGWGYQPVTDDDGYWEVVQHNPEMVSITLDQRVSAEAALRSETPLFSGTFISTPKFDGGSARAYYKDGILESVTTRGDGKIGLDVKDNLILNSSPPEVITDKQLRYVDGDIVISWPDFMNIGGTSPRDVAVTMSEAESNRLDHEECLVFMAYGTDRGYQRGDDLDHLRKLGFHASPYLIWKTWADFVTFAQNKTNLMKFSDDYPIDGLILRDGNNVLAFKFEDERGT